MSGLQWIDGKVDDDEPTPPTPWQQVLSVLALLWLFDFALSLRSATPDPAELEGSSAQLRATLERADAAAEAGHRTILLIGDSVLTGDALASTRLIDHLRRELGRQSDAQFEQIAVEGLLPVDAVELVAELDRLDPSGRVELVVELELGDFASQYAEQTDCTRPEICELGDERLDPRPLVLAWDGIATAATRVRDQLLEWTPIHRRRDPARVRSLERVPGLAVGRGAPVDVDAAAEPEPDDAAQIRERYRSASIDPDQPDAHAQLAAVVALLDHAAARGRKLTLFVPPLADSFVDRSFDDGGLGQRYSALARLVDGYRNPSINLLDLDHPLFVDAHFIDHVQLGVEGARLLALNLLHELELPLAERPFEAQMIHPEGHDRTLVHRVETGYAEGGAWQALFDRPEGVAVGRDGTRIVVADTHNQVLRELRGNMQFVVTIAGQPDRPGASDGPARVAELDHPRGPELLGDAVWFIDGRERERLRVLEHGLVQTPTFTGPSCSEYLSIRARPAAADRPAAIWALCTDGRLIHLDVARGEAKELIAKPRLLEPSTEPVGAERPPDGWVAFDLGPDALFLADTDGRLWQRGLSYLDERPRLGKSNNFFANHATELLPTGHKIGYPYAYDQVRLAKVVDLRFIERYGGLLIADEFPLHTSSERLERELTERVQLRYFDLDAARILPWIKPVPHGEAFALYNEVVDQVVSYWHLGALAIAQDDASLVWIERRRSRLFRVADGLLGVAKSGNHHTPLVAVPLLQTISVVSRTIETQLRPDRFLDTRHEPLARRGPYVGVVFGSSLSSMSDRMSNYSLGRRLELELQRELGYRDLVRLDLFQVSRGSASFGHSVNGLASWMASSVPPDVVFIEAHDLGGGGWYMRSTKTRAEVVGKFQELRRLADRYDTLVVFYDISSLEANRRDAMRATDEKTRELLDEAAQLGFVVLEPGDHLLRELLRHSPWGNQPFAENQHHGATWAVDMTAQTLAAMAYPRLSEFFRDRIPARERERPVSEFDDQPQIDPLRPALAAAEIDSTKLASIEPGYIQTELVDNELRVYVDLAGFRDDRSDDLDALAVAVVDKVLREDVYADFAETLRLELVEFDNYDEYGNGVLESAESRWKREFDRDGLTKFLRKHGPKGPK